MSWDSDGAYSTQPLPPYTYPDPSRTIQQTPAISYDISDNEFIVKLRQVPRIEIGSSSRFEAFFQHRIDGAISTFTTGPTVTVKDGNGNTYSTGVTIGTVTMDVTPGLWFSIVQFASTAAAGNYEINWNASYTPTNSQEPKVALPINKRRQFILTSTQAQSKYWFKSTASY